MKKRVAVIALVLLGILMVPKNSVTNIEYTNKIYKKAANETFNGSITFNSYIKPKKFVSYAHEVDHINPTADGGWVATESMNRDKYYQLSNPLSSVVKYKANGEIEWEKNFVFETYTSGAIYTLQNRNIVRFDGFSAPVHINPSDRDSAMLAIGSPDGGIFLQSSRNEGMIAKLDKDGNLLWRNQETYYYSNMTCTRACEINSDNVQNGKYRFYSYYQPNDSYRDPYWMAEEDAVKFKLDDNYYACGCKSDGSAINAMNDTYGMLAPLPNGGVAQLISTNNRFLMGDGTIKKFDNYTNYSSSIFVLIYDKDGKLIQVVDLVQYMKDAYPAYAAKNNISGSFSFNSSTPKTFRYIGAYDNGDLLVMIDAGRHMAKLHYNQSTNEYEPIWYSKGFYTSANVGGDLQVQLINETGGFAIQSDDRSSYNDIDNLPNNLKVQSLADRMSNYTEALIFEYADDSDGKGTHLSNIITTALYMKYYTYIDDENEDIREADIIHPEVTNMNTHKHPTFTRMEDGSYIVATAYNAKARGNDTRGNKVANTYKLADGTIKRIKDDTTFVVYRINKDDRIEWAQEYSTTFGESPGIFMANLYNTNKSRLSFDKKHILIPATINVNFDFKDITNDESQLLFTNTCNDMNCYGNSSLFLIYDVGYDYPGEPTPDDPEPQVKGEEVEVENPQTGVFNNTIKLVVIITLLLSIYYMLGKFNVFKKI